MSVRYWINMAATSVSGDVRFRIFSVEQEAPLVFAITVFQSYLAAHLRHSFFEVPAGSGFFFINTPNNHSVYSRMR